MLTVGIDIGGTKIAGGVVNEQGDVLAKARVETPRDVRDIEGAVVEMVRGAQVAPHLVGDDGARLLPRRAALHAPAWRGRLSQVSGWAFGTYESADVAS